MKIIEKENRIYFDNHTAYGNISIHDEYIKLELIRVHAQYRRKGFARELLDKIIQYIKTNFIQKKIILSPLPLSGGDTNNTVLNLPKLITFYKKNNFKDSPEKTRDEPYLMVRYL